MRTKRGRCPPAPPASLSHPVSTTELAPTQSEPWVRIFWKAKDPLGFAIGKHGNRFDPRAPPWEATKVMYAGENLPVAVAETVLRWHAHIEPGERVSLSESAHLRDRRVARFKSTRPLQLIDASGLAMAKLEEVVSEVVQLPENAEWKEPPKPIAEDIFHCDGSEYTLVGTPVALYERGSEERRTVDDMVGHLGWGIET